MARLRSLRANLFTANLFTVGLLTTGLLASPAVAQDKSPAVAQDKSPAVAQDNPPAVAQDKSPAVAQDKSPAVAQDKSPAVAQDNPMIHQNWSFDRLFGTFDLAAAQRGFQIYANVCSNCHSMQLLHYRDLSGIGLDAGQIKAIAAGITVPLGVDDQGNPKDGPATPASQFKSPFANEKAARAANNGALPPDLSLIVNAREGGPDYIDGLLTGFEQAPSEFKMQDGMYYNKMYPGHQIAMPQPLQDGTVEYADGTGNTLNQEAQDVVTFLSWAANPETVERKQMGVRVILFLVFMTGLTYAVKRKVWSDLH